MTDEEIDAVIARIANGENVLFGEGAPHHYAELLQSESLLSENTADNQPNWLHTGFLGANNTHQWITSRAFTILNNDRRNARNWFASRPGTSRHGNFMATVIGYSDWPDHYEGRNQNDWHFYHVETGTNFYWNRNDSHTARSRFEHWYNQAVAAGRRADWANAARFLGKAIHYLSDLNSPPHTGDRATNVLGIMFPCPVLSLAHGIYEMEADVYRDFFLATTSPYYNWHLTNTPSQIARTVAVTANQYYPACYLPFPLNLAAIQWPLTWAQQHVAALLYKFYVDSQNPITLTVTPRANETMSAAITRTLGTNSPARVTRLNLRGNATMGHGSANILLNLATVDLSGFTGRLGNQAFRGCTQLTTVILPAGNIALPPDAFRGCRNLLTLHRAGNSARVGEADLTGVTSFGTHVFSSESGVLNLLMSAPRFHTVRLPRNVAIPASAFQNCSSLRTILFDPAQTTRVTIGANAFHGVSMFAEAHMHRTLVNDAAFVLPRSAIQNIPKRAY